MGNTGSNTRDVNAAERVKLALQLRAQKLPYDEIARRCGYANRGVCHNAVQRELQRTIVANVEELRREESLMLDYLQAIILPLVDPELVEAPKNEDGDEEEHKPKKKPKVNLFAVDRILAISERRAKLFGLDTRPDDQILQQNYVKKIVIVRTSEVSE